ncbi:acetolactate synthase 2 catalytic subunit [Celerinatantimonas diazotrophica]|uniref:Acetolactate synthase n=1 Tax=Celerinatantimonas diazotrophica TaxID=412034 RepID=A0A4V2PSJ9_9GAMM|nr:acetolactate synthase 2 catalytic subunit [Celerinatantimonas diazotrophica]TCK62721.1 acetolactate synthase large subunit [Celerinatantimonas diazotrophica]CAG9298351.1 Acetolactate synthase isozyme 2 large subunit [Celerinatantimonas diazotrophica]
MNGAQLIVNTLKANQVNQVFGYPGGAIMPLYDALYDGGLAHQLTRHEQGAAIAAIGYARASGKVGVCIATSGPGATNLITGLADAMMDSIPVVAITGQVSNPVIGTDAFQEVDVLGLSLACCKHSFLVNEPEQLAAALDEAFFIAQSGRPGPVIIDIPKDVQLATIATSSPKLSPINDSPERLDQERIEQARALLHSAQKPVLYMGGGIGMANAVTAAREFINVTQIPSVTTLKGIGTALPDTPCFMGMLGMHGNPAANLAVQQSDLLIVAGARFDDRVTGKLDTFAPHAKVIHIDIDAAEIGKLRAADVAISDDLSEVLHALQMPLNINEWRQHTSELIEKHRWRYNHPGKGIYAPALLKQLSDQLPGRHVIACDVGQHQMWVAQHMQFTHPYDHISSSGFGTMGYGLPAAIGAKFARPDETVIAISGDGSFMMNVQELGTIKRAQLAIKIVLIDNHRLGMVRQWQDLFFDGRQSETILDDNPDFITLASAFDIPGESITEKEQIAQALDRMLKCDGPYLLHVAIDEKENVWPLVPPGAANHQMLEDQA